VGEALVFGVELGGVLRRLERGVALLAVGILRHAIGREGMQLHTPDGGPSARVTRTLAPDARNAPYFGATRVGSPNGPEAGGQFVRPPDQGLWWRLDSHRPLVARLRGALASLPPEPLVSETRLKRTRIERISIGSNPGWSTRNTPQPCRQRSPASLWQWDCCRFWPREAAAARSRSSGERRNSLPRTVLRVSGIVHAAPFADVPPVGHAARCLRNRRPNIRRGGVHDGHDQVDELTRLRAAKEQTPRGK